MPDLGDQPGSGTAPADRKKYTTFVVEREIGASRTVAFDAACALICEASSKCPAKASCKMVQGAIGLCTYDS